MKKVLGILLMVQLAAPAGSADTIVLKDGTAIEAEIVEQTEAVVRAAFHGGILTYDLTQVEHIERSAGDRWQPPVPAAHDPSDVFRQVAPAVVVLQTFTDGRRTGQGSGFLIGPEGVFVTAYHVLAGSDKVVVQLKDGRRFPVTDILGYDQLKDVCVARIDAKDLPTVLLGDSDALDIGQRLLVISSPKGYDYSIADGLLSGRRDLAGGLRKHLQFSVPVARGSSGGPLLNLSGQAVGVISAGLSKDESLNFAIPIREVMPFIREEPVMTFEAFVRQVSRADAFVNEAAAAVARGETKRAIELLTKAIAVDEQSSDALLLLALMHGMYMPEEGSDALDAAIRYGEQSLRIKGTSYGHVFVGRWYVDRARDAKPARRRADHQAAVEHFKAARALDPKVSAAYAGLAMVSHRRGEPEQALAYAKQELEINPKSLGAHMALGRIHGRAGRLEQAVESYRTALRVNTQGERAADLAHASLCRLYIHSGEQVEAFDALERVGDPDLAGELQQEMTEAWGVDASLFGGAFDDEVRAPFELKTSWAPGSDQRLVLNDAGGESALTFLRGGDLDSLDAMTKEHWLIAKKAIANDRDAEAVGHLRQALARLDAESPEFGMLLRLLIITSRQLGIAHAQRGEFDRAIEVLESTVTMLGKPRSTLWREKLAHCYYYLGMSYAQVRNRGQAQRCLRFLQTDRSSDARQWANDLRRELKQR